MKEMWNERFGKEEYAYGVEPNKEFKEFIDEQKPGKLLLLGEGEGRNAVYAAKLGWQVTSIDFSKEGQKKALLLAKNNNVDMEYLVEDVTQYSAPDNTFDCIALSFLHMHTEELFSMLQNLHQSLTQKGKLFIVGFHTDQLNFNSGGPKNKDWLLTVESLEKHLSQYTITRNDHLQVELSQGYAHQGTGSIVIFTATK